MWCGACNTFTILSKVATIPEIRYSISFLKNPIITMAKIMKHTEMTQVHNHSFEAFPNLGNPPELSMRELAIWKITRKITGIMEAAHV